jgi:hypothetical protein
LRLEDELKNASEKVESNLSKGQKMQIRNCKTDKRFAHLHKIVEQRFDGIDSEQEAVAFDESFTEMVHIEDNGEETYLRFWNDPEKVLGPINGLDDRIIELVTSEDLFLGTFGYKNGCWHVVWLSPPYESEWVDFTDEFDA